MYTRHLAATKVKPAMQTNPEITMMILRSMRTVERRARLNSSMRPATPGVLASVRAATGTALIAIGERIAPATDRRSVATMTPRIGRADI